MYYSDLTFPTPHENMACDEVLLDLCEEGRSDEVLRFWEPGQYFVVVGYGNKVRSEVNVNYCQLSNIPILRRCTGGGTVLQGPGVINYTLVLRIEEGGPVHSISATNNFVLQRNQNALAALLKAPVEMCGQTDLAVGGLKFCGNAQRRKKRFLIFHGCFLLHLDIDVVEKALLQPSKQPEYRFNRSHSDFLMNLKVPSTMLKAILQKTWDAYVPLTDLPSDRIAALAQEKYTLNEWNFKF